MRGRRGNSPTRSGSCGLLRYRVKQYCNEEGHPCKGHYQCGRVEHGDVVKKQEQGAGERKALKASTSYNIPMFGTNTHER